MHPFDLLRSRAFPFFVGPKSYFFPISGLSLFFTITEFFRFLPAISFASRSLALALLRASVVGFSDLAMTCDVGDSFKLPHHHARSCHIPCRQLDRVRKLSHLPVVQLSLQYRCLQPPDCHLDAVRVFHCS